MLSVEILILRHELSEASHADCLAGRLSRTQEVLPILQALQRRINVAQLQLYLTCVYLAYTQLCTFRLVNVLLVFFFRLLLM